MVNSNEVTIFIQARIFSTRLRSKILQNFFGETVIERLIRIAKNISKSKSVYVLTGNREKNLILKKFTENQNVNLFFGDENNVLERYRKLIISQKLKNNTIIRLTSDNYLIQPNIIKLLIKKFNSSKFDYAYIKPLSHFSGEIFNGKSLLKLDRKNNQNKDHVTYEFRKNKKFNILELSDNFCGINHKKFFTLDNFEDLKKLQKLEIIYPKLKNLNCIDVIKDIQKNGNLYSR
tara:strand:+ start:2197 stop:2895 length:699 start_codon:yes stop_codon:yes gene_type:complete